MTGDNACPVWYFNHFENCDGDVEIVRYVNIYGVAGDRKNISWQVLQKSHLLSQPSKFLSLQQV